MQIIVRPGVLAKRSQPDSATLALAKAGRHQTILTNLSATVFYVAMGPGASDGTAGAGGTFDFILKAAGEIGDTVVIDNYTGVITCDPAPAEGDINVSQLFGSNYRQNETI
jgi:16S rRNA C1402 N4-methylase RsmH